MVQGFNNKNNIFKVIPSLSLVIVIQFDGNDLGAYCRHAHAINTKSTLSFSKYDNIFCCMLPKSVVELSESLVIVISCNNA